MTAPITALVMDPHPRAQTGDERPTSATSDDTLRASTSQPAASMSGNPQGVLSPILPALPVVAPSAAEGHLIRHTSHDQHAMSPSDSLPENTTPIARPPPQNSDYFSQPAITQQSDAPDAYQSLKDIDDEVRDELAGIPAMTRTISARSIPQRPSTALPVIPHYPDQSLASLQARPIMRAPLAPYYGVNTSPSQASFFPPNASSSTPSGLPPRLDNPAGRSVRTAGNTPAQTPGLFSLGQPAAPISLDGTTDRTPLPSPYLHPVQTPVPRTTRSAQRDIDFMSGRKMINHYEIINELGRGMHGKVKLARDLEGGDLVAIKIVQRYNKRRRLGKAVVPEDKVKKEIAILKKVQHPNIVRLIEVIDDPELTKVYIVLEYCEQRELIWRVEGMPHIVLMEYFSQERDANAISEDASNANISEIQRMAARRRERNARRRLEAIQSAQARGYPDLWSLEYATESDDNNSEDDDDDTHSFAGEKTVSNSPRRLHLDSDPGTSTLSQPKAISQEDAGYSFYSTEWYPDQGQSPSVTSIDEDLRRQRQASVADSFASRLTERMDSQVPSEFRYVPTMTLDDCRSALRDALVGLEYLHYHGIIHRDIKPENLLRTSDNSVKISDFGVSYLGKPIREEDESTETSEAESVDVEDESAFAKTVGTPAFYAPELCRLDMDAEAPVVKAQIDIWALGITLYCLIFARTPYDAENEFALMKRIREEEIFIPRSRLKAVDPAAADRQPGHAPLFQKGKRNPHDFVHERIDDELHDLLRRLFNKDPTKRITIKEIKHHPWIVQDLRDFPDPASWIDTTDPSHVDHGKKIEISSQEVRDAVMPINTLIRRIKSMSKRATSALGLGARRRRGQSSATSSDAGSSGSISDLAQRDVRGLSKSSTQRVMREREVDHPLSRSVTASPDPEEQQERLDKGSDSPTLSAQHDAPSRSSSRPSMPERHASELSTTASIKTVRPSDFERGRRNSLSPPVDLPDFYQSHSALGAIFGGAKHNMIRAMRSRDRFTHKSGSTSPTRSSTFISESDAFHGVPTAAVTNTSAPGHSATGNLDFPDNLKEKLSAIASPSGTPAPYHTSSSTHSSQSSNQNSFVPSRESSFIIGSLGSGNASLSPHVPTPMIDAPGPSPRPRNLSMTVEAGTIHSPSEIASPTNEEEFRHAMGDMMRRRALESVQERELAEASRPSSSSRPRPCPPSPDDLDQAPPTRQGWRQDSPASYFTTEPPFDPTSGRSSGDPSEASHSRSTSFPSCPSALSASSSISSNADRVETVKYDSANSSEGTTDTRTHTSTSPIPRIASASDDGYHGDGDRVSDGQSNYAVESDDEESDSDGDEFLTMTRRKPNTQGGQIARTRERTETAKAERKASRGESTKNNELEGL